MNILVFGANSAIAQAACRIWIGRGDKLFLVGRNPQTLEANRQDLQVRSKGGQVLSKALDLTRVEKHQELLVEADRALGSIDLVFIAHGELGDQQRAQQDFAHTQMLIDVNYVSPLSILTHAAQYFEARKKGGIAVITSVAGDRGRKANYVYASAKGGVSIFLSGLRGRLNAHNIAVTNLKLGFVDTPMTAGMAKGPLWARPDVVAHHIVSSIDKLKDEVYIPWFWFWIMLIIKHIPHKIFKKLSI